MGFNRKNFEAFCRALQVDTKDYGLINLSPEKWLGTQRRFVDEIEAGMGEGVHTFVVLKGRQVAITTICLALDLYWLFAHQGVSGSLVTHDEETRDMFRSMLSTYMDGLPKRFKVPVDTHNRTQLAVKNRSRFSYQVAGTRKNTSLGKGKALMFLHATEVSAYGDEEGLASLRASLSEHNPNRLYIYESTAQGMNHYRDMWEDAKASVSVRAIFIGWWLREDYAKGAETPEYRAYWDGKIHADEKKWIRDIKRLYDFEIKPEQIAWWRWKLNEEIFDQDLMYQNYPPTEEYAFIKSGSNFFNMELLSDFKRQAKNGAKPNYYKFLLGDKFDDMDVQEVASKNSNLTIWEYPVSGAYYVIGADPAYGSSDWADRFCASVWRCYADGTEQVAEFCTTECSPSQFAWVILYLAGAYGLSGTLMLNLELNGPGMSVLQEVQGLKQRAFMTAGNDTSRKIMAVVANLQQYLYRRIDTFGRPNAYHWQTTTSTKERMMNLLKGELERSSATARSVPMLEECEVIVRDEGSIEAPGRQKDDRVIAAALAHVAWGDYIRMQCMQAGVNKPVTDAAGVQRTMGMNSTVVGYMKRLGIPVPRAA
jgi:hypothetical protein